MRRSFVMSLALASCVSTEAVPVTPPPDINEPIGEAFISYSVEFSWWPEFAGNLSHPNTFSDNLLTNLAHYSGVKPHIRVGGCSQDNAWYDPDLVEMTNRTFGNPTLQFPTVMTYGPSFFEGYKTFEGVKFSHGFNLGSNDTTGGPETLRATLPLACAAIPTEYFGAWEIGNEPDHFANVKLNRGPIRDVKTWTPEAYVAEWRDRRNMLEQIYRESGCEDKPFRFLGPSFAGLRWLPDTFASGLNADEQLTSIVTHHYIAGAREPTSQLQATLMNHTLTNLGIASQTNYKKQLAHLGLPYMIGEGNSLFNQGLIGASDVFGGALWSIDFALLAASAGIHRVHFHTGVDYHYAPWQPAAWEHVIPATKPPYYGHVAVAATLGRTDKHDVQVSNIPLEEETESAYAIYEDGKLVHVAVLNMVEYNYTASTQPRPSKEYSFTLSDSEFRGNAPVQRLIANGSDAISGITWDGFSYNHYLEEGRPVRLCNVTTSASESVRVNNGAFTITLPHSSYALLNFR